MDADGSAPVNSALQTAASDNAVVKLPPGEYRIDPSLTINASTFGIVGLGDSRRDVRFTVPSGSTSYTFDLRGGEYLFENFTFDQGFEWDRMCGTVIRKGAKLTAVSTELLGADPHPPSLGQSGGSQTEIWFPGPGAELVLDDFKKVGPVDSRDYPEGRQVVLAGNGASVTVRNSDIRNTSVGQALYLSNTDGDLLVENNYFENTPHTAIRVPGGNATVRNNMIVIDPFGEYAHPDNRWNSTEFDSGFWPQRGILVWDAENWTNGMGKATLENNVVYHGSGGLLGCVVVGNNSNGAEMRGGRVHSEQSGSSLVSGGSSITIEGAEFSGQGSVGGSGSISDSTVAPDVSVSLSSSNLTRESLSKPEITRGEPPSRRNQSSDGGSEESSEPDLPNTLTIEGTGTPTNYEFAVSGDLAANPDGGSLESWDELSDSTASGWVTNSRHADSFAFGGEVTEFEFVEGEATVLLNGEEVDPASLGGPETHTLTVKGAGTATNYEFTVSGDLAANPDGGSLESWDGVSGSTASGWVTYSEHVDSFTFTGEVTEFEFVNGEATVLLDGEEVDPDSLGGPETHSLTIEGTGTSTNYEFTVSGDLSENADEGSLESWDDLSDSTANGWVTTSQHVDSFTFTGEVTAFEFVEGGADVYLDGEQIDPSSQF